MTDRFAGVLVTFERDIREDDMEPLLTALRMLKGVAKVSSVPADIAHDIAYERARRELADKIWDALK